MLKLYNTLSRKKEIFQPRKGKKVGFYTCGPTVYGPGHIGHARTYIIFDIIRRYLEYKNYKVKYVMNITDIHDDIIKEAKKQKKPFLFLANKYTKIFLKEQRALGIKVANNYPRVTKHIPDIIHFIQKLIKKGYAYEKKGSVYFDISKFKDYGKLSRIKFKKAITSTRIKTDKYKKTVAVDFALWKKTLSETEPSWLSPWGAGRPGWHIECSVMSQKHLEQQIDIHGGARDLIFPHHENEIAQSEAINRQKPFVKYWLHSGLITINGQKMSRSLGNYIEINQVLKKWSAQIIRFFIASVHYRSQINYSEKALLQAKKNLEKITEFVNRLKDKLKIREKNRKQIMIKNFNILSFKKKFEKVMDDDFNTPKAIAVIFELINKGNFLMDQNLLSESDAKDILDFLQEINQVWGFLEFNQKKIDNTLKKRIEDLVKKRNRYRLNNDWENADKIRDELIKINVVIRDDKDSTKWEIKK